MAQRQPEATSDAGFEVDATLRRTVVLFRVLAWVWMWALLIVGFVRDDGIHVGVAVAAGVLATLWVGVTIWAARNSVLQTTTFVLLDGAVALAIGAASSLAGAADLFHGGMPISWLVIAAYAMGLRGALPASLILGLEQVIVHIIDGRGVSGAVGSLVFPVFAIVLGAAFDALRTSERLRQDEVRRRVRHEERADLANRLHDSVLQTLQVVRTHSDDSDQVRYLARRQERELRRTIEEFRSPFANSMRAALLGVTEDIEDTHRIEVNTVIRDDIELTERLNAVIGAAREALVNAAKHSGVDTIDLYAELGNGDIRVFVRDRGRGFVASTEGERSGGLTHAIAERVAAAGGTVDVDSAPGEGAEVTIMMPVTP